MLPAIKDKINEGIHIEKSEEVSLRYVAGYIIISLKKSIKSKRSPGFCVTPVVLVLGIKRRIS